MNSAMKAGTATPEILQRARARRRRRALLRPAASLRTRPRGIAPPTPLPGVRAPETRIDYRARFQTWSPGVDLGDRIAFARKRQSLRAFDSPVRESLENRAPNRTDRKVTSNIAQRAFCSKHPASEPAASPEKPLRLILRAA